MGKVFDSTETFATFDKKSRVYKNMSKNNYYLKTLQNKVDDEWKYRGNIVDIEEETDFGSNIFIPIEVKIQNVYDVTMKTTLSDNWKKINYKNIFYKAPLGQRYRFSLDFINYDPEDENLIDKSIWIGVNIDSINPTHGLIIRRCDSFLTICSDKGNIHYEPICIESDFKHSNLYLDQSIVIPQGELYAIMQYNAYTKFLKINDRFLIGPTDSEDRYNNTVFKVRAIRKYQSTNTYNLNSIPLVFLALDKDDIGPDDDLKSRIVKTNGTYREKNLIQENIDLSNKKEDSDSDDKIDNTELSIRIITEDGTDINERILLNTTKKYYCYLYKGDKKQTVPIQVETDLLSTDKDIYYYDFEKIDDNSFCITNKKMYLKDELKISCFYNDENNDIVIKKEFLVSLGGAL